MTVSAFPYGIIASGRALTGDDIPASMVDLGAATTTYGAELEFRANGSLWLMRDISADVDQGGWVDPEGGARATDAVKYTYVSGNNTSNIGNLSSGVRAAISVTRDHGIRHTSSGGSDEISQNVNWHIAESTGGAGEIGPFATTINVGELF